MVMRATCAGQRSCCAHKEHAYACMTELLPHFDENMETGAAGRLLSAGNSRESVRARAMNVGGRPGTMLRHSGGGSSSELLSTWHSAQAATPTVDAIVPDGTSTSTHPVFMCSVQ